ncbi:MAG: MFS transporter [Actinobacteria bacterium]|nr:MFS transporter [Actinomycetota bacterium]
MRAEIDRRAMVALSSGHLATDFASGAVPALVPFLVERYDLSYTQAAVLMLAALLSSSVVQPVFGLLSDKRGAMWLLPGGVALGGVGVALAAAAPSYPLAVALIFAGGVGIAAFHPEGSKFANYVSGPRRASGMALFNIGGNSGYALGPIVATPLVVWLGLKGGLLLAVPTLAAAAALARALPYLRGFVPERQRERARAGEDRRGALVLLLAVIALRSVGWFGLLTFVPLWMVERGHSEADGNRLLSLMLVSGAIGTLVVGPASDRIGHRRTMQLTQAALAPLGLVFVLFGGVPGAVALALVGACVVGSFTVTMVLSQEYLPRHLGTAAGLSVGMAMGVGGVAAVALGAVADAIDLRTALLACAATPALGAGLCLFLPAPRTPRDFAPEPVAP